MVAAARFDYMFKSIDSLRVQTSVNDRGNTVVDSVLVNDEPMQATDRFWTSLFARFGFNSAFFKYFSHAETFDRISKTEKTNVRLCVERGEDGSRLLAVSNPAKPVVGYDDLMTILDRYNGDKISYVDGIVESTHTPRVGNSFDVLGDTHENRFVMQTPIDGYGTPNIYLSLMRLVCTNGMVGLARAFRSNLALGNGDDNVGHSIIRALDGFNNDEGYAAIRQRLEAAGTSWLSVFEAQQLYKLLIRLHHSNDLVAEGIGGGSSKIRSLAAATHRNNNGGIGSPIIAAFHRMTGDPAESYGLANLDALSAKRQRTLPVNCTVYDAINFATEVATHHARPGGSRRLNGFVGTTISEEYDMEGTKDRFGEFADFLVDAKMGAGLTGSQYAASAN
jgi:hypothetical protein